MSLERQLNDPDFALFGQGGVVVTGLDRAIDLNPDVDHQKTVTVTPYPIESGGSLTDNAVVEPDVLTLRSYVSDLLISENTALNVPANSRAAAAWGIISEMFERREPLTVVTRLQQYDNMLITSLRSRQDEETGNALVFTMRLEEVLFSETRLVRFPPSALSGPAVNRSSRVDRGEQQAIAANEEQTRAISRNLSL